MASTERRLGRGLETLLAEALPAEPRLEIELRRIQPNPFQPRRTFEPAELERLRDSIQTHGVLQPVVLRQTKEGEYELIAGERRWRAARLAGLSAIPAVTRTDVSDEQMLELALIENVQRRDLNPIEKAQAFQRLIELLSLTQEELAARVSLQRSTVANHLRLLELPDEVRAAVSQERLSMGHAKALLGLTSNTRRVQVMADALRRELTVRALEELVRRESQAQADGQEKPGKTLVARQPWARELERRMGESLETKVSLRVGANCRGQIVLEFFNRADLERLYQLLAPPKTL